MGLVPPVKPALNINDLVELTLKRLRPIARKKDVELVFESIRSVVAEVDEVDGRHGRFQLMGHILHKLLPGGVQGPHTL